MSHSKFVALAVLVALPLACSGDRRDTETPGEMTPASGQWPAPTNTIAPQGSEAPKSSTSPSGSDTTGNPHSTEAGMREGPDTDTGSAPLMAAGGTATGGTSTGGRATGGTSTGGRATGGTSTGGRATGGTSTGGRATGGTSMGGTTGTLDGSRI